MEIKNIIAKNDTNPHHYLPWDLFYINDFIKDHSGLFLIENFALYKSKIILKRLRFSVLTQYVAECINHKI